MADSDSNPFLPHQDFLALLADQQLAAQRITCDPAKRTIVFAPEHSADFELIVEDEFERARRAGKRGEGA